MTTKPLEIGASKTHAAILELTFLLCIFLGQNGVAQYQQAWVAHYNNGITNGTNQAVKMALDSAGDIYVAGYSQNSNTNLGYVTIKYAPNGNQLWASRYDSTNYPTAEPTALALDSTNSVVITGSAVTIKYDSNGNPLWTFPDSANALAVDGSNNVYITGVTNGFETIKLNSSGSNLWATVNTGFYSGPKNVALAIALDSTGDSYIAGYQAYSSNQVGVYVALAVLKLDTTGNLIWRFGANTNMETAAEEAFTEVCGLVVDGAGSVYVELGDSAPTPTSYWTLKFSNDGTLVWGQGDPTGNGSSQAYGMALDNSSNVIVTGKDGHGYPNSLYGTYKINTNGVYVWTNTYPSVEVNSSVATAVAIDQWNNAYVTGYSPGTNSGNDIVTISYGPNGNLNWIQRYNGPGNGNDAGAAIAVDNSGNVYVTGYDTLAGGGTEIVTIKYSPLILKQCADGTVLLQAQGSSGEEFDVQASADLQTWQDLGQSAADANGLFQFDDTNAPQYPARFYVTIPQ